MRNDFFYTPYELALIILHHSMDVVSYMNLLSSICHNENYFIPIEYRFNHRRFILHTIDNLHSLCQMEYDSDEENVIKNDMETFGLSNNYEYTDSAKTISNITFKELRLRILYINKNGYARMKLRTLLSSLGYKRRSKSVIDYINSCLSFYHISTYAKNNFPCDITEIGLDEMVIFKIIY